MSWACSLIAVDGDVVETGGTASSCWLHVTNFVAAVSNDDKETTVLQPLLKTTTNNVPTTSLLDSSDIAAYRLPVDASPHASTFWLI